MTKKYVPASEIIDRMFGDDPEYWRMVAEERYNAMIARDIYRLRKESGLTQKELADLVGTTQSAISRLEDADYEGHSLGMLDRIASALKYRLKIEFLPENDSTEPDASSKARIPVAA